MAKAPEKQDGKEEAAEAAPKKKGKLLLFIIIGVLLVVFAVGGGAAYFLLKKKPAEDADAEDDGGRAPKKELKADKEHPPKPPTYLKLETFTTNLLPEAPEQPPQYIQVVVELRVPEPTDAEQLKGYMPELRDKILRLLTSRKPSQLVSLEGKDALAAEIRATANRLINPPAKGRDGKMIEPTEPVQSVHFSSFIIQ
jgi:flagellar FliL protein